jgi:menaquinone-dependent protoporphyrinogen IX oxidase
MPEPGDISSKEVSLLDLIWVSKTLRKRLPLRSGYDVKVGNSNHKLQLTIQKADHLLVTAEIDTLPQKPELMRFVAAAREREKELAL